MTTDKDQSIYFIDKWVIERKETLEALARGEGITFASGKDAIDWLKDKG